ncbi:hypothetical protein FTUN_3657 [Frigoriglobus tundricola]|uniref:Uncharacterized protein n=1 Tax=Frigoriglobus tundricola TaxID=2774151 RepID=A0A6M5YS44_9BACT|nr:hypothetical protein FTUN_3657 [Frigoriglobus tundricola]
MSPVWMKRIGADAIAVMVAWHARLVTEPVLVACVLAA